MQNRIGQPHVHSWPHDGHEREVVQSGVSSAEVERIEEAFTWTLCDVDLIWNFHLGRKSHSQLSLLANNAALSHILVLLRNMTQ